MNAEVHALYAKGDFAAGLAILDGVGDDFPDRRATIAFGAACLLARMGDADGAVARLDHAFDLGSWWAPGLMRDDSDLDSLHDRDDFADLMERCEVRATAEGRVGEEPLVLNPSGEIALVALHGAWSSPQEAVEEWAVAADRGLRLVVPASRLKVSKDGYRWDRATVATEIAELLATLDTQTVVLGGFSQGGAVAVELALGGTITIAGYLAVCPTFGLDPVLVSDVANDLPAGPPGNKTVPGFFLIGGRDHLREGGERVHADLAAAGYPVRKLVLDDLGHQVPDDFGPVLDDALAYILDR